MAFKRPGVRDPLSPFYCGCYLVVEFRLPKPAVWVRFPSPAYDQTPYVRAKVKNIWMVGQTQQAPNLCDQMEQINLFAEIAI